MCVSLCVCMFLLCASDAVSFLLPFFFWTERERGIPECAPERSQTEQRTRDTEEHDQLGRAFDAETRIPKNAKKRVWHLTSQFRVVHALPLPPTLFSRSSTRSNTNSRCNTVQPPFSVTASAKSKVGFPASFGARPSDKWPMAWGKKC